jgi:hypothetical protein
MMKVTLRVIFGLVAVGSLVLANRPAEAQTVAPGPPYPTLSWDQKIPCDTLATCPRFIVLSNWNSEAVLDRETGLVWQRSPLPGLRAEPWVSASAVCNAIVADGNRRGWRVPTIQELASLVELIPGTAVPPPTGALPAGHPFRAVQLSSGNDLYWSASTCAADTSHAWAINFVSGAVYMNPKTNTGFIWCVRGGHGGVDPQ